MPGFKPIIGQQLPIRILQRFINKAAVPHALLFTGIEGIGKRTVARQLAMVLNCGAKDAAQRGDPAAEQSFQPCGVCRSCLQIASGSHPDIIEVAPVKETLRIDQIRSVLAALTMKPFSARYRVVIIANAQTLNVEAGNALLKALEEPPADTIIVLTALQGADLLPTIVSRCRHIRFSPLATPELKGLLAGTIHLDAEQAEVISEMAGGSYTQAVQMADVQWSARRDWTIRASGLDQPGSQGFSATLALSFAAQLASRKGAARKTPRNAQNLDTGFAGLAICASTRYQSGSTGNASGRLQPA